MDMVAPLDLLTEESELLDMLLSLAAPLIVLYLLPLPSLSASAVPASRLNIKADNNFFFHESSPFRINFEFEVLR